MKQNEDNKPEKRVILLSLLTIFISAGILGGFFLLQRNASTVQLEQERLMVGEAQPEQADKNLQATLEKATELRDKWSPWARTHKADLQRVLKASSNDQNTFLSVLSTLPDTEDPARPFTQKDMGSHFVRVSDNTWRLNPDPNVVGFAWSIMSHTPNDKILSQRSSAQDQEEFSRGKKYMVAMQQADFVKWHDIAIARSSNEGFSVTLWASGRITEQKWEVGRDRLNHTHPFSPQSAPVNQVLPPYDFLK